MYVERGLRAGARDPADQYRGSSRGGLRAAGRQPAVTRMSTLGLDDVSSVPREIYSRSLYVANGPADREDRQDPEPLRPRGGQGRALQGDRRDDRQDTEDPRRGRDRGVAAGRAMRERDEVSRGLGRLAVRQEESRGRWRPATPNFARREYANDRFATDLSRSLKILMQYTRSGAYAIAPNAAIARLLRVFFGKLGVYFRHPLVRPSSRISMYFCVQFGYDTVSESIG